MKLSEHAKALRDGLDIKLIETLESLNEKLATEKSALEALQKQRLKEETDLEAFRRQSTTELAQAKQALEQARNDRAVELRDHGKVMEAGAAALAELKASIAKAKAEYDGIISSIEAIRKRLG